MLLAAYAVQIACADLFMVRVRSKMTPYSSHNQCSLSSTAFGPFGNIAMSLLVSHPCLIGVIAVSSCSLILVLKVWALIHLQSLLSGCFTLSQRQPLLRTSLPGLCVIFQLLYLSENDRTR